MVDLPFEALNTTGNMTDIFTVFSTANNYSNGIFMVGAVFAFFVILFSWIYDGTIGKSLFGSGLATTLFAGMLYYAGLMTISWVSFFALLTAIGLVVMINE